MRVQYTLHMYAPYNNTTITDAGMKLHATVMFKSHAVDSTVLYVLHSKNIAFAVVKDICIFRMIMRSSNSTLVGRRKKGPIHKSTHAISDQNNDELFFATTSTKTNIFYHYPARTAMEISGFAKTALAQDICLPLVRVRNKLPR